MFKKDALAYFDNSRKLLAAHCNCSPEAVSQWGDRVPEVQAARLEKMTCGVLSYSLEDYGVVTPDPTANNNKTSEKAA